MLLGLLCRQHDVGVDGGTYQPAVGFHMIAGPISIVLVLVVSCCFYSFCRRDKFVTKLCMLPCDFVEPFHLVVKVIVVAVRIVAVEDIVLLFLKRDL